MRRTGHGLGDGDTCPVDRSHGAMLVLVGNKTQYCPDQSHDGTGGKNGRRATQKLWPYQFFAEAVREYNERTAGEAAKRLPDLGSLSLPELDLEGFDA